MTPEIVEQNRAGLYEWMFQFEADWGVAMIDAYQSVAFTSMLENKQFVYFNIGTSETAYSSGITQPYREKSVVTLHESVVAKITEVWKPVTQTELSFILHKEKNITTQKVIFMVEFISRKIQSCIPYLKGTVNIQISPDKSKITHIVTISTWLSFPNESNSWLRTPNIVYQRNMASCVYYGLHHFFELLFTQTNKIFE
jgi:hypothetical protein